MTYTEKSHPEAREEEQDRQGAEHRETLATLGKKIDELRKLRKPIPSDRQWVREWAGLGSAKTWSRVVRGEFEGMDVAAKIPNYRAVLSALSEDQRQAGVEELYDDLAGAEEVTLESLRLLHHHGKDRLIVIEGGSGSGKTSCLDILERSVATGNMIRVEADDSWKSVRAALGDILMAAGVPKGKLPSSTSDRLDKLRDRLGDRRVFLTIDEAHHATGSVLNIIKTILNQTGALVILAGMNTLLDKLRASSSEEAKQLYHNRLFSRIILGTPDSDGIRMFLHRRLSTERQWKRGTLGAISGAARNAGHWSFIRRVVDHLRTHGIADPDDADLMAAADTAQREIAN